MVEQKLIELYKEKITILVKFYDDINEKFYYGQTFDELVKFKPKDDDITIVRDPTSNQNSEIFIEAKRRIQIWLLLDASIDSAGVSIVDVIKKIEILEKEVTNSNKQQEIIVQRQIIDKQKIFNKEQYYLFFDTETTGLPKNWKAPLSDLSNWPRLVQLAYILCNDSGDKLLTGNFLIKPEGFIIPTESSKIHGITNEIANREGSSLQFVLQNFTQVIEKSDFVIAHNMAFDEKIIGAEFLRLNLTNKFASKEKICTMQLTTNFCAIQGQYGYKWPKLSELHYKLFGHTFEEAHNAAVDIEATCKCYWELKRKKIV